MRKTKIICTIGPASSSEEKIKGLIQRGMNVARLNFSHGSPEEHLHTLATLRRCAEELNAPLAILQDLQGPKIRIGSLERGGRVRLEPGAEVTITTREILGNAQVLPTSYQDLPRDVKAGEAILLADGQIELEVLSVNDRDVHCRIVHGGVLGERQGLNLPHTSLSFPAFTDKDRHDLALGLEHEFDYVALSFVRTADNVRDVTKFLSDRGADTPIIAKLETHQAMDNLEEILDVVDGVMIARGDLGVELPLETVPTWQKRIIREANRGHVLVITATQMMESMIQSPHPTRAEASDVANAVYDGTDAVMLSGETAVGAYPIESVEMMDRIVVEAESIPDTSTQVADADLSDDYSHSVSYAARQIVGINPSIRAIVAFTQSGYTARLASKSRPSVPILALTPNSSVYNRLALHWGVVPRMCSYLQNVDDMVAVSDRAVQEEELASAGESVIILGSLPLHARGTTNFLRLHRIGDITPGKR